MRVLQIILIALGWVFLAGATAAPLLASVQLLAIGLGLLLSAVLAALARRQ